MVQFSAENSVAERLGTLTRGRPFPKGVSGNPGGRPRRLAELEAEIRRRHSRKALSVLRKLHDLAMAGDVQASKLYLDRVMGPARTPVEPITPPQQAGNPAADADVMLTADGLLARALNLLAGQMAALEDKAASHGLSSDESAVLGGHIQTVAGLGGGLQRVIGLFEKRLAALSNKDLVAVLHNANGERE